MAPEDRQAPASGLSEEQLKFIDNWVGARIRLRRVLLGLSEEAFARALNIPFQQVRKYEDGTHRIGASRLFQIAAVLQIPITYFFEEEPGCGHIRQQLGNVAPPREIVEVAALPAGFDEPQTAELIRAFYALSDSRQRRAVLQMLRSLGPSE